MSKAKVQGTVVRAYKLSTLSKKCLGLNECIEMYLARNGLGHTSIQIRYSTIGVDRWFFKIETNEQGKQTLKGHYL